MSTEQELAYWRERAAFEEWFTKTKAYISDPKHIIAQVVKDIAWEAWQAAIEAERSRGGAHAESPYSGCGCNSDDCRVNGCLSKRQTQSAMAPGGGSMLAEPVKSSLKVSYDTHGDCLYVVCDSNEPAHAEEDDKGILYRHAISDGRLVGITIMNFMGRRAESSDDVQRPAEPVKMPNDAEIFELSHDFSGMTFEDLDVVGFARALLARYGQPIEPVKCIGCEGKPAPENNPCAVCGKEAESVAAEFPAKGKLRGPLGWVANTTNPEPVKRKRPYAQGTALGEFGVIPMRDQVDDEPVKREI